jgi:hypothetical protein
MSPTARSPLVRADRAYPPGRRRQSAINVASADLAT